MQIILNDGTALEAYIVTGEKRYVQGASRDVLTFVFDESFSMDQIDALFTEANCESITLVTFVENVLEDGTTELVVASEDVHKGYTVRESLKKYKEEVTPATSESEAVFVTRVSVGMAQRTYAESKLVTLEEEITNTQLALVEVYEGGLE